MSNLKARPSHNRSFYVYEHM